MTEKLYQKDMYLREFDAEVISLEENRLILSATAFAPDAGGQPCDKGIIGGFAVTAVHEREGMIVHELDLSGRAPGMEQDPAEVFAPGKTVHGSIDWDRRFDHMQNHLGEHILSGLFKSQYDLDNRGFHLGEDSATFDIDAKEITEEMLANIENLANQVVWQGLPVQVTLIESSEEAAKLPLRKELKAEEDITVVTVPGVDCVACCCPHPSDTAQIGLIKLVRTEKYKGMTRIHFRCGRRALLDYQQKHRVMTVLSEKYSADEFSLLDKVKAADAKNEEQHRELNRLKDALAEIRAAELLKEEETGLLAGEFEKAQLEDLRQVARKLVKRTDRPIALCSLSELCVFLTHSGKSSMKCGQMVKEYAVGAGGKGGGGDSQAQVFFNNEDLMRNFIAIVRCGV